MKRVAVESPIDLTITHFLGNKGNQLLQNYGKSLTCILKSLKLKEGESMGLNSFPTNCCKENKNSSTEDKKK